MELLIPGLILVGIMAWLSTRIKRDAAAAYEREEIDGDGFTLIKPAGFLHPLNSSSGLPFEAYSKEYGEDDARKLRQAWAELRIHEGVKSGEAAEGIRQAAATVLNEETVVEDDNKVALIDAERLENEVPVTTLYKIVERGGKTYELRISVLDDLKETFLEKCTEMRASFRLK